MAGEFVKRYRSKPVEVNAVLVTESNVGSVAGWCGGVVGQHSNGGEFVMVPTINGEAQALLGHYVVEGPNDYYPCDPDTFESRWAAI